MKETHIFVSGIVQGVGFRALVKKVATQLGIKGFVRNLKDGRVEICAQGEDGLIQTFLQKIKTNPGLAVIHRMQIEEKRIENTHSSFIISFQ